MTEGGDEATRVLPEAQAGLIQVLRPYTNFETSYQGQSGLLPLMFTPGGVALDKRAGQPGYSPNLVAGLSIAMASRLLIYLPHGNLFAWTDGVQLYNWWVIWRIRNARDWRISRIPFHYPKQGDGTAVIVPGPDPGPRVVIPAAWHPVIYQDPGPAIADTTTAAFQRINVEVYQPQNVQTSLFNNNTLPPPLNPNGAVGQIEQGVAGFFVDSGLPSFQPVEVSAMGDELLIACTKELTVSPPGPFGNAWGFADGEPDRVLSVLFGVGGATATPPTPPTPDVGVYVSTVSASP
jgi:hypothetical protein